MLLLLAFIAIVYAIATMTGHYVPTRSQGIKVDDWDLMDIAVVKNPEPKLKSVKPQQPKQPKIQDHPLYKNCVAALVGLGTKKSDAVSATKDILSKNDVQNVEEFIRIAFSN